MNGTTYDANNLSGTEVFLNVGPNLCDSIVAVNLNVLPNKTGTHNETVCFGGSIVFNGTTYNANNLTGIEVFTNVGPTNCDSTVTVTLTIENELDITTTTTGLTLTANQVGATYKWLDCTNGNAPIANETGQSFVATVNGNYAVVVTVGNCSDTSACITISTVGIEEQTDQLNVFIYPNPTEGKFNISLGSINQASIKIVDVSGKLLHEQKQTTSLEILDVSHLEVGVYIIQIASENGTYTERLIKE